MKKFEEVLEHANDLEIEIINLGRVNVLESLKQIERTGKKVRLERLNNASIKVRSIYDHIHSLAKIADAFLNEDVFECDDYSLACFIVYHDLCECLITDFPSYTKSYETSSKAMENVKKVDKNIREEYATNFLWLYANDEQKKAFEMLESNNDVSEIFTVLDAIDPIICIWRYIFRYRTYVSEHPDLFVKTLEDFFTYPRLEKISNQMKFPIISEIIDYLRNQDNAREYARTNQLNKNELSDKALNIIRVLVEETPLFYYNTDTNS